MGLDNSENIKLTASTRRLPCPLRNKRFILFLRNPDHIAVVFEKIYNLVEKESVSFARMQKMKTY